jgi:hypothetical protein
MVTLESNEILLFSCHRMRTIPVFFITVIITSDPTPIIPDRPFGHIITDLQAHAQYSSFSCNAMNRFPCMNYIKLRRTAQTGLARIARYVALHG